jgi:hypothetical protein
MHVVGHEIVLVAAPAAARALLNHGPSYCPMRPPQYAAFNTVGRQRSLGVLGALLCGESCQQCCLLG